MGALDRIIQQTVTRSSAALTRAGFGVPMLIGYHNVFSDRVREYNASSIVSSMIADGFDDYDPLVRMAGGVAGQSPAPSRIKIGKITAVDQSINVTPYIVGMVTGETFALTIRYHDDTVEAITPVEYNGTDTVEEVCDKLVIALSALTGAGNIDVTDNTTHITIAPDVALPDGSMIGVEDTGYSAATNRLLIEDTSDAPSIAADIAAIAAEDDDWYCLLCVHNAHAVIDRIATAIESMKKMYVASTADSIVYDPSSTTDVAYGLNAGAYQRTGIIYHQYPMQFAAARWAGSRLANDPGAETWAFKTVTGATVSILTESRKTTLENKGCNYYSAFAGRNITLQGFTAAGVGFFLDATRDADWIEARMQEDIFAVLVANSKVPKTDEGIALILNAMNGVLQYGVTIGVIAPSDPTPLAWGPKISEINATELANRVLPDLRYVCRLSGAFHKVLINGVVQI